MFCEIMKLMVYTNVGQNTSMVSQTGRKRAAHAKNVYICDNYAGDKCAG